jgi:ketosteroid isomerase-like protein
VAERTDAERVAREGFAAWQRGDFKTLAKIFDADVQWRWFEPGDWDCRDRDDVLRVLRQRHSAGFARGRIEIQPAGEHRVIVTSHPSEIGGPAWPPETATVIEFRDEKIVSMQDYRTAAEARIAAGS